MQDQQAVLLILDNHSDVLNQRKLATQGDRQWMSGHHHLASSIFGHIWEICRLHTASKVVLPMAYWHAMRGERASLEYD